MTFELLTNIVVVKENKRVEFLGAETPSAAATAVVAAAGCARAANSTTD